MAEVKKCGFKELDEYGELVFKDCTGDCKFFLSCTRNKYTKEEKEKIVREKENQQ